jgi:hypothetical protein
VIPEVVKDRIQSLRIVREILNYGQSIRENAFNRE